MFPLTHKLNLNMLLKCCFWSLLHEYEKCMYAYQPSSTPTGMLFAYLFLPSWTHCHSIPAVCLFSSWHSVRILVSLTLSAVSPKPVQSFPLCGEWRKSSASLRCFANVFLSLLPYWPCLPCSRFWFHWLHTVSLLRGSSLAQQDS